VLSSQRLKRARGEVSMLSTVDTCRHQVKTDVYAAPWDAPWMKPDLLKRRFLELAAELTAERGSERQAAKAMGIDPSLIGKIRDEPRRSIGVRAIETIQDTLGLDPEYFSTPAPTSYRLFLRTTVLRDSDKSPYQEFEQYIADERLTDPDMLRELRAVRFATGSDLGTYDEAARLHARLRSARRGKLSEPTQIASAEVPEGRRRVLPGKKKR
jgi:hypothetical protein